MALPWKHVVPWTNRTEFVQTYLDLYSKNAGRQRTAVETISLWKCRAVHKLSVAIESSAALTEALLQYQGECDQGGLLQRDFALRTMLSMALIRFVNHLTEKGQNKAFAQPVHKLAEEYGIPDWIVRLRHDATHASLPCLDVLCVGVQWALSYLQDVFWSQQVKEADEYIDPDAGKCKKPRKDLYDSAEIQELLRNYRTSGHKSITDGPESEAAREASRTLRRLEHVLNGQRRNCLLKFLVDAHSGHLLPLESDLISYGISVEETFRADPPRVPGSMVQVWREVLRLLHQREMTGLLLQHMLMALLAETDPASLNTVALVAWLRLILLHDAANYKKSEEERASVPELYTSSLDLNKDLLLATCLQHPNVWTCSLLPLVGGEDTHGRLDELEKLYKGNGSSTTASGDKHHKEEEPAAAEEGEAKRKGEEPNTEKVFSLSDLKSKPHGSEAEEDHCWNLCTEPVDWDRVALGMLPSQISLGNGDHGDHRDHSSSSSDDEAGHSSDEDRDAKTKEPGKEVSVKMEKEEKMKDCDLH